MLKIMRICISTSFTVQVDAPLPIDQDLKTIAQKTYPNPAGEVTLSR
jgi:hypothetical protein